MARISTRNLIDGGERTTPPKPKTPAYTPDPQDVRDPVTGLTPAQVAAQKGLAGAVAAGAALGIETKQNVATTGNVPTVTVTKVPTTKTVSGPTGPAVVTGPTGTPNARRVVNTYTDEVTGDVVAVYSDGTTSVISKGNKIATAQLAAQQAAAAEAERRRREGQSAYDLLFGEFERYGMGALVEPLKNLIVEGMSRDEMTLRLRQTDAYRKRFAANQNRINKGLRALSEAEYVGLEDQYQNIMRNYGLPASYYTRGEMGRQEGFEKFIGADVSPAELEDRVQTAYNRVINANPQVAQSLRSFYPDITDGDILAYALDPDKALSSIKRKVTSAEIGAGAMMAGLGTDLARAEELQRYGVTGEQARAGYQSIAEFLPTAQKLGDIYAKQGAGPFTQTTAEEEVFGTAGAAEAGRKRRRLAELETATFSGQAGAAGGALARERAGSF